MSNKLKRKTGGEMIEKRLLIGLPVAVGIAILLTVSVVSASTSITREKSIRLAPGEKYDVDFDIGDATAQNLKSIKINVQLSGEVTDQGELVSGYGLGMEFYKPAEIEVLFSEDFDGETIETLEAQGWQFYQPGYGPGYGAEVVDGVLWIGKFSGAVMPQQVVDNSTLELDFNMAVTADLYFGNARIRIGYYDTFIDVDGRRVYRWVSTERGVWNHLRVTYYDDVIAIYINDRFIAEMSGVSIEGNVNLTGLWWEIFFDNISIIAEIPLTTILALPSIEDFHMTGNEWSLTWNFTLKTENVIEDSAHEIYITPEQAEAILANPTLRLTNLSARALKIDSIRIMVSHAATKK